MRKETGKFILEFYDDLGCKVLEETASGYITARARATQWEETEGYSVVVYRVLYNSKLRNDKWQYDKN